LPFGRKEIPYKDLGAQSPQAVDYANVACLVGTEVAKSSEHLGLLFCGTGVGISIAANKIKGIRAACCSDYFSAKYTVYIMTRTFSASAAALSAQGLLRNWWMYFWTHRFVTKSVTRAEFNRLLNLKRNKRTGGISWAVLQLPTIP
jgi:hypothetical protein